MFGKLVDAEMGYLCSRVDRVYKRGKESSNTELIIEVLIAYMVEPRSRRVPMVGAYNPQYHSRSQRQSRELYRHSEVIMVR